MILILREEVEKFAQAMELELRRHDSKKGKSWKKMSLDEIESMIRDAVKTVEYKGQDIDIANLCMMHYDNDTLHKKEMVGK